MANSAIFLATPAARSVPNCNTPRSFGLHRLGPEGSPGVRAAWVLLHSKPPRYQCAITPLTLCVTVTSLLKAGSILQQIVALGDWQLTHNGAKPSKKGDYLSQFDIKRQAKKDRKANPAACCWSLPGVWTHLGIGVWSAITREVPLTSSSLCDGQTMMMMMIMMMSFESKLTPLCVEYCSVDVYCKATVSEVT